jgi:hypothetical protein
MVDDAPDHEAMRLVQAFMFLIRSETHAVNRASLLIQRELASGFDDADPDVLWEAVYSVLSHSANLSKIFWPPRADKVKAYRARGEALRAAFDLADDSPLHDRTVRNGFEHIDEWIHTWMAESKSAMIDHFIGSARVHEAHAGKYLFRSFDHETSIVTIGTESVELFPLLHENDRIYERWRELDGQGTLNQSTARAGPGCTRQA